MDPVRPGESFPGRDRKIVTFCGPRATTLQLAKQLPDLLLAFQMSVKWLKRKMCNIKARERRRADGALPVNIPPLSGNRTNAALVIHPAFPFPCMIGCNL